MTEPDIQALAEYLMQTGVGSLSPRERRVLERLASRVHHRHLGDAANQLTFGERLADRVARFGGSALSIPAGFSIPTGLLGWALVYFLGGYAIYGAQFAGIGALAPDVNQTKSITWIVMLPIIVAYMFMALSFDNPTGPLAVFLSLFPLTSSVAMIGRMASTEVPLWQAVLGGPEGG